MAFTHTLSIVLFLHFRQMWEQIHRCWVIFDDKNGVTGQTLVIMIYFPKVNSRPVLNFVSIQSFSSPYTITVPPPLQPSSLIVLSVRALYLLAEKAYPVIFKNFFKLKYSWFTMVCRFLLYSKVTQLYTYRYSFLYVLFHYGLSQDTKNSSPCCTGRWEREGLGVWD